METSFAFFYSENGSDFNMIATGLPERTVGMQAVRILRGNPGTAMRAARNGFEITEAAGQQTWRWVPDSEVK